MSLTTVKLLVLAPALALALAACNGDDVTGPTQAPENDDVAADVEAFCDDALGLGSPGEPEVDWETATEEEIAAAQQVFAEERLRPLVEDLRDSAPQDVQDDVATLEEALDEAEGSGDLEAFFGGAGGQARNAIAIEAADRCGWSSVDVTMVDYEFQGVPETLQAGPVVFSATNEGEESHEMIVFVKREGVEETWEEILGLEEAEVMERVEFVAATFAPAGEESTAAADLDPGEYVMVCFIPQGTDASGEEAGDGPPHFQEGMFADFTVE
ncbi:MAG TPA: hypothetical protein VM324_10685 [Egibacteraceae bacterium]|nr:hypothetical protein [Egibacteraceae bacterium]